MSATIILNVSTNYNTPLTKVLYLCFNAPPTILTPQGGITTKNYSFIINHRPQPHFWNDEIMILAGRLLSVKT